MSRQRVHVLVLRDSPALVSVGLMDMLRKADALAAELSPTPRRLATTLVSPGPDRTVALAGGIRLECEATIDEVDVPDLVVVPALDPDIQEHLELNAAVPPWLRRVYDAGADVASACTGAFALAEAGLLDGKAATTHWAFQADLARRYPAVELRPQAIIVDQGRVVTAGGATSFLSLSLHLVERLLGGEIARAASKMFLIDPNKSPQGAYAIFGPQKAHGDEEILRAQGIIEQELALPLTVDDLARQVVMSRRNFVRRFTAATGNSPREYLQRARIEAAKRALETTRRPVATVASDVGYEDVVAFRRMFARITGLAPSAYRARYGLAEPGALVSSRRA
ncbi:MAG: GlxA family transcriptional regulator [Actinophytocola sp.]|uniref:GlxA family transcriptional regulator n=1 Tax=Actinophytocola sp. TaxID=1872138 RepID=UPI003D6C0871